MQPDEIKALRERLGMTQEAFARGIGMSRKAVNEMEKEGATIEARVARAVQLMVRNLHHPWGNWRFDSASRRLVYIDPSTGERDQDFDVDVAARDDAERIAANLLKKGLPETQSHRLRLALIEADEFSGFEDYQYRPGV